MRIGMVFYDMQELGGLEEYATSLAIGLQELGHEVSVLSAMWVAPDNQYLRRLCEHDVPIIQWPKWFSYPISHWPTKEKVVAALVCSLKPLLYLLGTGHFLLKRSSWRKSFTSAHNWLRGQLMTRFIGPDRRKLFARLLLSLWRLCWRPNVLHIQGCTTSLLFAIDWAHARGLPVVYEEHQTPDTQFDWWEGFQKSINKAGIILAVSEKSAQALQAVCGVTRPVVVRPPLLPDPMVAGWEKQGRPQRANEHLRITTVARLYVTKGLTYLLNAIAQIKASHPTTQFRVYGEGPLRQELLAQASKLGLDGSDIFVGAFTDRKELSRIMAETDIFVMSSILEGQPLALVEAMAFECPVVATRVGGIPELISDGVNGLLCEPADSTGLAQKIQSLIESSTLRETLGKAARRSYKQGPFQPSAVCSRLASVYKRVLQPETSSKLASRLKSFDRG